MANTPFKKSAEQKKADAEQGLSEYRAKEAAVNKNTGRLRAMRLAHEAANPPQPVVKAAPKRAAKKKAAAAP